MLEISRRRQPLFTQLSSSSCKNTNQDEKGQRYKAEQLCQFRDALENCPWNFFFGYFGLC
jgi:hypothetical protein